jgi:hypothetical protein
VTEDTDTYFWGLATAEGDGLNCDQQKTRDLFEPILRMLRESEFTSEAAGRHVISRGFSDLRFAIREARDGMMYLYEDKEA